jgi:hypothetical protein
MLSSWSSGTFQYINLYSDIHYVVGVLCHIETASIGHTSSEELFKLFWFKLAFILVL